jgi:D-serine dehydratase
MLVRLACADDAPHSVRELALDNQSEADGLAVARASELVVGMVRKLVSGIYTVPDRELFELLHTAAITERLELEPSAAAGIAGPRWLNHSAEVREYLNAAGLADHLRKATHIVWTTGGSLVPADEHRASLERGRQLKALTPSRSASPSVEPL